MNRRFACLTVAACWAVAGWADPRLLAGPQTTAPATLPSPRAVLEAIPADAAAFVVIRDLETFSNKLTTIARQLGLPVGPEGPIRTPLVMFKEHTGLDAGLITRGSVALVVLPAEQVAELAQRSAVLVPTDNFAGLIAPLKPKPLGAGRFAVTFARAASLAGKKGDFAVFAPNQATLQAILGARQGVLTRLNPDRLKRFEKSDVLVWIDGARALAMARPFVEGMRAAASQPVNVASPAGAAVLLHQAFGWFDALTDGLETVQLTLAIGPGGIKISLYTDAKPGTPLAETMATARYADHCLLFAQPAEGYAVACGGLIHPQSVARVADAVDALLGPAGEPATPQARQLAQARTSMRNLLTSCRAWSMSIAGLPAEQQQGLLGLVVGLRVDDAEGWIDRLADVFDALSLLLAGPGEPAAQGPAVEFRPAVERIAGSICGHLVVHLERVPDLTPEQIAQIKRVLGPEGVLVRVAPVGKGTVVLALGGGKERMAGILKLAAQPVAPLQRDPGIRLVSAQLATPRGMEVYVALDRLVALAGDVAAATGGSLPLELAPLSAPLGFVASGGPRHTEMELFAPTELIVGLRDLVMQYFLMTLAEPMATPATTAPSVP